VALAHLGAGDTPALTTLLRMAVADGNDDVRRAATTGAGLALCGHPEVLVRVLSPLAESHVAHVRYGAAMALGLCAGQGDVSPRVAASCVAVLGKLCEDKQEVVRQAAFLGMGLASLCATDPSSEEEQRKERETRDQLIEAKARAKAEAQAQSPLSPTSLKASASDKVKAAKSKAAKQLRWTASTCLPRQLRPLLQTQMQKRGDALAKFGALHAAGLTEAGGRNVALSLHTARGQPRLAAAVGVTLFLQHWFWMPLVPALSLALAPQAVIGVSASGRVPTDWRLCVEGGVRETGYADLNSAADAAEQKAKVLHAMSQTRKAGVAARAAKREQKDLERRQREADAKAAASREAKKELNKHLAPGLVDGKPAVLAHNPLRVPAAVQPRLREVAGQRYRPTRAVAAGVVVLRDTQPELPEEPIAQPQQEQPPQPQPEAAAEAAAAETSAEVADDEPAAPKPFEM
jgi:26S proteasome regulatory subunit N2